jgi:uncharacterized protein (UPF0264 family)
MMKILISPISVEEAQAVAEGGADIIDIKNIAEGSLGASFPWIIREVVGALREHEVTFSATLGDLPFKPGTASLAALGAAVSGARYIKAGLYGVRDYDEALQVMQAVARTCKDYDPEIIVVAAGYADYRRFGGLDTQTLIRVARDAEADVVMVDTAIKDGKTLFDALSLGDLQEFIDGAHANGLQVALAGSVRFEHLDALRKLAPDIVGVRGCVCSANNRATKIEAHLVRRFVDATKGSAKEEAIAATR